MILKNAIQTPDGTILESTHVHDFKMYKDKVTGKEYGVDGGLEYFRYIGDINDCKILSIETDNENNITHEDVRNVFKWGTRGKNGKEPLKKVLLKDLSNNHIQAIIDTQLHITNETKTIFENELKYRKEKDINIID